MYDCLTADELLSYRGPIEVDLRYILHKIGLKMSMHESNRR